MNSLFLSSVIAACTLFYGPHAKPFDARPDRCATETQDASLGSAFRNPKLSELALISELPPNIPRRVSGFAFDGERFWAAIYHGKGLYAIFDPLTLEWRLSDRPERHKAIRDVAGLFESPGGITFIGDKLWVVGSYGESFGSINLQDWKIEQLHKLKQRTDDQASQSYAGLTFDGRHLWIAWHWFKYNLPVAETQLLLKIDPETGMVVAEYPIPGGTRNDMTHGLTWDGTRLWHIKDNRLSAIDSSTGMVLAEYTLGPIKRASGLAWDEESLWIVEFDGKLWRLPFEEQIAAQETRVALPAIGGS